MQCTTFDESTHNKFEKCETSFMTLQRKQHEIKDKHGQICSIISNSYNLFLLKFSMTFMLSTVLSRIISDTSSFISSLYN